MANLGDDVFPSPTSQIVKYIGYPTIEGIRLSYHIHSPPSKSRNHHGASNAYPEVELRSMKLLLRLAGCWLSIKSNRRARYPEALATLVMLPTPAKNSYCSNSWIIEPWQLDSFFSSEHIHIEWEASVKRKAL